MPNLLVQAPQGKRRSCRARCFLVVLLVKIGGGWVGVVNRGSLEVVDRLEYPRLAARLVTFQTNGHNHTRGACVSI